jgi:hypothetical protein
VGCGGESAEGDSSMPGVIDTLILDNFMSCWVCTPASPVKSRTCNELDLQDANNRGHGCRVGS